MPTSDTIRGTPTNERDYRRDRTGSENLASTSELVYHSNTIEHIRSVIYQHCNWVRTLKGREQSVEFILKYSFQFPASVVRRALKEYDYNRGKIMRVYLDELEMKNIL